jgi:hypothetical protein
MKEPHARPKNPMRALSIAFILLACVVIAIARFQIRRRRSTTAPTPAWPSWMLLVLGFIAMIIGVVLW